MIIKNYTLRKFIIKMNERNYHDFLRVANEYGLTVEEKIYEIIDYYILVERKRFKICGFTPESHSKT